MNILGISAGFHDAAATVINNGEIIYAAHAERYSRIKNDPDLHSDMFWELSNGRHVDHIAYYETPWKKQLRQLYSGQGLEWNKLTTGQILRQQLQGYFSNVPVTTHNHHLSHAAGGFQTSPFDRATVVVIDAIGEWDTISIWGAHYVNGRAEYRPLWKQKYPHSIGLFYTAMTENVGLKPMEDEYILMGMAAYGSQQASTLMKMQLVDNEHDVTFKENLHTGLSWDYAQHYDAVDIASSAQALCENLIYNVMRRAKDFGWLIEILVSILKKFGSCLILVMLVVVLALPHSLTADELSLKTHSLVQTLAARTLSMPSSIVYSQIKSLELLPEELNLDPEPSAIEVSSPTPADQI